MRRSRSLFTTMIAAAVCASIATSAAPASGVPPTCMSYAEAMAVHRAPAEPFKAGVFRDIWRWIWGEPLPPATPRFKGKIVCRGSEG